MGFDLNSYETVEDRLKKFWSEYPNGRIDTYIQNMADDGTWCVVGAHVYKDIEDERSVSSGYAQEFKGQGGFANKEAWLENCETSAIGRALANWKYQGSDKARPSRQEMSKVTQAETPVKESKPTTQVKKKAPVTDKVGGPIKILQDAGFSIKETEHSDGTVAIDNIGLWCPCGGGVNYIPASEKKSDRSPDFRCIMASKCTAGDTVDGKVFSKSWWVDNKVTPAAWNDYASAINGVVLPSAKSLDDVKPGEAPF
jgi:hypothetical protein